MDTLHPAGTTSFLLKMNGHYELENFLIFW